MGSHTDLSKSTKKIKRKSFFLYLGASALGVYSLTKFPFKFVQSKFTSSGKKNIKVKINPLAVKRESAGIRKNG